MSLLIDKQVRFARGLGQLLVYAGTHDVAVRMGECWRSPEEAERLWKAGLGIKSSVHRDRLAVDLVVDTPDGYAMLGTFWRTLASDHAWGGDFVKKDWGHYSMMHNGRR